MQPTQMPLECELELDYYAAACTIHINGQTGFVNRNSRRRNFPALHGNALGHTFPPAKDMFAIYRQKGYVYSFAIYSKPMGADS